MEDTVGPSTSKRLRVQEPSMYPAGTIKRVKVHNFMTYGEPVTIEPGPRLNLVLGPNGTGKSSLVCALCIGLAGSTKLLGRADNIKDFIKRGQKEGYTEITLSGGPEQRDYVIRREMKVEGKEYRSSWKINNQSKRESDVKELVANLNIQFDNLCQFLPQDKVVEFARMNPQELLLNTEKAIGDATLYNQHQELAEIKTQAKKQTVNRDVVSNHLQKLKVENEKLEREYKRFQRRQALEGEVDLLNKRSTWLKVDQKKRARDLAQQAYDEALTEYREKEKDIHHDERPLIALTQQHEAAQQRTKSLRNGCQRHDDTVRKKNEEIVRLQEEAIDKVKERNGLEQEAQAREARIRDCQQKISHLSDQLQHLPPLPSDINDKIDGLDRSLRELTGRVVSLQSDLPEMNNQLRAVDRDIHNLQGRLEELNNERYQRLRVLEKKSPGVTDAYEWVTKNRHLFQQEVLGPVANELTLCLPEFVDVLEQQCYGSLLHFVTRCREDERTVSNAFKEMKYRGTVACTPNDVSGPIPHRKGMATDYAQYGLLHTLDEVFDAPPLIKHHLSNMSNIGEVFIGSNQTEEIVDTVMRETGVSNIYTPKGRYTSMGSKYNATVRHMDFVPRRGSHILLQANGPSEEGDRIAQQMSEKQQEYGHIEQQIHERRQMIQELQREKSVLESQLREVHDMRREHKNRKDSLAQQKKVLVDNLRRLQNTPDPRAQWGTLHQATKDIMARVVDEVGVLTSMMTTQWNAYRDSHVAELHEKELSMQRRALLALKEAARKALEDIKRKEQVAQKQLKQAEAVYNEMRMFAEESHPLTRESRAAMETLPDNQEALEDLLEEKSRELASIVCSNPGVVLEYQTRKKNIEELEKQLSEANQILAVANKKMEDIRQQWLPQLQQIVEKINTTFSHNFACIGAAGEVQLHEDEDYDKFAINILVKYRHEEELQVLSATRQSGGERSVATIVYLVALQDVTVTPFRVVDEINQGMDPINERKVFMQLVDSACQEGTPQCFLLTPKLLPDLPFTREITILNIFNGPQIAAGVAKVVNSNSLYGTRQVQEVC